MLNVEVRHPYWQSHHTSREKRSELLLCCSRPPTPRSRAVSPGPDAPQGAEAKKSAGGSGAESKPRIRRFVPDIQEIRVRYVHDMFCVY